MCVPAADGQRGASGVRADEFVYEYRVFTAPDLSADTMRWNSMESYYLIGVSGDFYIIMNSEETIGYIPQDWFWAGNG